MSPHQQYHSLRFVFCVLAFCTLLLPHTLDAQQDMQLSYNGLKIKMFTIESQHFVIHYMQGLEDVAREAGAQFEHLYSIYSNTYHFVLPSKTTVMVADAEITNGFAESNSNFITIWCHDFDFNLRGTHDWLKGVCSHEFAHIVSISSSFKLPSHIPVIQLGYISHPNEQNRIQAMHYVSNEIFPPWFAEGIAQFEDSRYGTDSWDTHRDMILRTLTESNNLLSWAHMNAFAGKGDDFEKTYNHGFSLIKYIATTYGYEKVVAIIKACKPLYRFNFEDAIKATFGFGPEKLYSDWKKSIKKQYDTQIAALGKEVTGHKINKYGYDNLLPKFSPLEHKIYFLSNDQEDYSHKNLYSYALDDTVKEDDKIKMEKAIGGFYSVNAATSRIAFSSMKSDKSVEDAGGNKMYDLFTDTIITGKKKFRLFPKNAEHQLTIKQSIFSAAFSPTGNRLACAMRRGTNFWLVLTDTSGKVLTKVYPVSDTTDPLLYIYSVDWSSDGHHIAVSYIDSGYRKIGMYDTSTHSFSVMKNSGHDDRDPRFGADGKTLYFSSDRTGIFNIYKYNFDTREQQQLTNVFGGAFAPDASPDQKKLTFSSYDKDGYGIYLLDSITPVSNTILSDSLFEIRNKRHTVKPYGLTGAVRPYSHLPNQFLYIPTVIVEQSVPQVSNVFKGNTTLLAGLVVNATDPMDMLGQGVGNEIGAYLLLEPQKFYKFINFGQDFFGKDINYEFGFFGTTKLFPVALTCEYTHRGIADVDSFVNYNSLGVKEMQALHYAAMLRDLDLYTTQPFLGMNLHFIASYNWYDGYMLTQQAGLSTEDFPYTLAKGYRFGTYATMLAPERDSRMVISPRGLYVKAAYYLRNQYLMNDTNGIILQDGKPIENYDTYLYHEINISLKMGMTSPWYDKHDFYAQFDYNSIMLHQQLIDNINNTHSNNQNVPSYYKPITWMPGYTYYFETKQAKAGATGTDTIKYDTVLITGNAVSMFSLSYRFPLWPKPMIDKKWGFLYFDKLYGAVNFSSGAGFNSFSDFTKFRKQDWLSSAGCELRLEAQSFGMPLAISTRWDRGFNRPAPIGGNRFTLNIGFSFDNWEYIDVPDYHSPSKFAR